MSNDKAKEVTYQSNVMHLAGRTLALNAPAPDFLLVNSEMKEIGLDNFSNKIKVITTLPSLDTPVCELQAKRFNESASILSDNIAVIAVSKDLPFAQSRFCISHGINNLTILSDYKYSSFGINYGLLIKELNLLTRAVIILDSNDIVRYIQIGKEITNQLDYQDALDNLSSIVNAQPFPKKSDLSYKCKSCSFGLLLSTDAVKDRLQSLTGWQLVDDKKIVKDIHFSDFMSAKYFLDLLSIIAEEQKHHPTFILSFNKLRVVLSTHAVAGLTDDDFVIAKIIDDLN